MNFDASRMLAFDLETTSANPKDARIVTSALVRIDGRDVQKVEHLADPGVEIPQAATDVHGITTEKAQAEGRPHEEVLKDTVNAIKSAWDDGLTLIVYNAAFDLTVLRSLTGDFTVTGPVFDPYVIDRVSDKWRKGKRTLGAVCEHYGVELGNAHEATADALAAARVAWKQVRQHYPNLAQMDENELMEFQAVKWYEDRVAFKKYLEGKGRDASDVSTAWPLIS
ncbi:3'-5' exonuclease [Corynebacterium rhinophilum]|uniref:3'-5' exonuclease n=1 Tax=Corynebacterium rhinophilum TaxID=3050197 RepID=UPI00255148CD|nr:MULTISPECIES: 3'-5' exonuclease [unclassified Corynebacterium]MDK8452619.1 3'-5' exonuclease [Corynebacterium sp. MSK084]MDK8467318.1 3'-5' exonuclease [Corynebacterium sp. MSK130]MDK8491169.1 3'-5' exonuclease [Corynebacterium sp. MSK175]MDK8514348.1 3'-5' exonuclease [Corynebacterium sp. MSK123]MDK8547783.1 3'-5' exonuclease [Corynebacterium sp. MSK222]